MKNLFFLFLLITLHSCSGQSGSSENNKADAVTSASADPDTLPSISEKPVPDSLDLYFAAPLDWEAYKEEVRNMLNCGKKRLPLAKPDSVGLFYNYCLFYSLLREKIQNPMKQDEIVISFHVWKKSLKGTEGYYHAKNEKLLGIQCKISDQNLGASDWVGKDSAFVVMKFGQPQRKTGAQFYYYKDQHLLVLHFEKNKITWFRYFWLAEPVKENDFTDRRLTHWNS